MNTQDIETLVGNVIKEHPELQKMIQSISVFGSQLHEEATEESDIDLLVEFIETPGLLTFIGIKHMFEDASGKKVDLVTADMLSKYFRDEVLSEAKKVYG